MNDDTPFLGALLDPRPEEEIAQDWTHEEAIGEAATPQWKEKATYAFYEARDQGSAGSCGAHSAARFVGIKHKRCGGSFSSVSAKAIYQGRSNTGAGMYLKEALALGSNPSAPYETQLPSQRLSESEINAPYTLTDAMKTAMTQNLCGGYVPSMPIDIDAIATVIDRQGAVQLLIFFERRDWQYVFGVNDPSLTYNNPASLHHYVIAVDYTLHNGVKCLVIEDSANPQTARKGQRLMPETFLRKRCISAGYLLDRKAPPPPTAHVFNVNLTVGDRGIEVLELQRALQRLGYLSTGVVLADDPAHALYGATITRQAVRKFQAAHGIDDDGSHFGPKTRAAINQVLGN
jgi:hypothetical protein